MEDIIKKLDKIKIALGDEKEDLNTYTTKKLSEWIKKQYSVAPEIQEILSYNKDDLQYQDRRHRMGGIFHEYFQKHEYIDVKIQRNKEIDTKEISELDQTRRELIETINSFYQIDNIRLSKMKEQFLPIIKELESFDGNIKNPNFSTSLGIQIQLPVDIEDILQNGPKLSSTQYHDRRHRLKGQISLYSASLQYLNERREEGIKQKDDIEKCLSLMNKFKSELINIIKSLNDISIDLKEKTGIKDILPYIQKKFQNGEIDVEDNVKILCSNRVFKAIIDELSENYRKYGTEGHISVITKDNKLIITLTNKKKEKNPEDFSSGTGTKIFQEYMQELGGSFESNYETEDCISTISLPLYTEQG